MLDPPVGTYRACKYQWLWCCDAPDADTADPPVLTDAATSAFLAHTADPPMLTTIKTVIMDALRFPASVFVPSVLTDA